MPSSRTLHLLLCSVAGLAVGCISPVKELLFSPLSPVSVLEEGISLLAGAALPCMLLVLGAILCRGPGRSELRVHVIVGVVIAKLIVMPLLGERLLLLVQSPYSAYLPMLPSSSPNISSCPCLERGCFRLFNSLLGGYKRKRHTLLPFQCRRGHC